MKLNKIDKLVFLFCFLLVVTLYWVLWKADEGAREVEVLVDGEKTHILDLFESKRLSIKGSRGESVIEIKDGQARFLSSPCNTSFCVRSGWQSHSGDFVACLPNSVSLHLVGGKKIYDAINF